MEKQPSHNLSISNNQAFYFKQREGKEEAAI